MSTERLDLAVDLMRDHVAAGRSPTVAAIVLRHGQVVFEEAVGVQRPGGRDLTLDDVWPIASAGKPLLAATVMSLVEEGRIGVMQPIIDYLPELVGTDNDTVLVHHLLTHSAGWESDLFSGRAVEVLVSGALPPPPPDLDLIAHLFVWLGLHPKRISPVGKLMAYGNMNYCLLYTSPSPRDRQKSRMPSSA